MTRRLLRPVALALSMAIATSAWAQPPRPKVLAFFTTGGETDHRGAARRLPPYMQGGGAWLGFHVSGFSSDAWPWYRNDFLGGVGFVASNWPSLPGRVNVDDPGHPTVKNVPASFVAPINEWYSWAPSPRMNPDIKVLLTLDKSRASRTC